MSEGRDRIIGWRSACLIRISLCAVTGRLEELGCVIREALARGVSFAAIREALLETYLFAGYPKAINALSALKEATEGTEQAAAVVQGEETALSEDPDELEKRGLGLMELIYGKSLPSLLSNMRELDPDLARWIVQEGYGKVLSRPGLDVKTRELCVIAILKVMDTLPQLEAHVKGAMNAGAGKDEIDTALALAELMRAPR